MVGVADPRIVAKDLPQKCLSLDEWDIPQIMPVKIEEIEDVVDDGGLLHQFWRRLLYTKTELQALKIAAALAVQNHDFAVEPCLSRRNVLSDPGQLRILARNVPFGTRP